MFIPIRLILCLYGIEWVWGICIGVGSALFSAVLATRKVPLYEESNGTDTHPFFIYLSQMG